LGCCRVWEGAWLWQFRGRAGWRPESCWAVVVWGVVGFAKGFGLQFVLKLDLVRWISGVEVVRTGLFGDASGVLLQLRCNWAVKPSCTVTSCLFGWDCPHHSSHLRSGFRGKCRSSVRISVFDLVCELCAQFVSAALLISGCVQVRGMGHPASSGLITQLRLSGVFTASMRIYFVFHQVARVVCIMFLAAHPILTFHNT
jgi:hypothetical protein